MRFQTGKARDLVTTGLPEKVCRKLSSSVSKPHRKTMHLLCHISESILEGKLKKKCGMVINSMNTSKCKGYFVSRTKEKQLVVTRTHGTPL